MKISQGAFAMTRGGLAALAVWALGAQVGSAQESQPAVWTPKELHFAYMGFTTHYSCQGLSDQVREILLQLGARKQDLKVRESGCTSATGRPEHFPAVDIKMSVLQPVSGTPSPDAVVGAHWKAVDVLARHAGFDAAGQCELYEQVRRQIVPLFTVRNIDYLSTCVPHQLSPGGQRLTAEVLAPDQPSPRS
jgi:hypothetical protein